MDATAGHTAAKRVQRRSEATRQRILEAAREVFADTGYDRATIRTIAGKAGINPAMVMRYYGSKEGLFAAASPFDLHLPDLSTVPRDQLGEVIVRTFLSRWERRGSSADMPALLRLSTTHPEGHDKAVRIFTEQVRPMLAEVIRSPRPEQAAALVATQIVGVAFLRYVLKLPAVVALSEDELAEHVGATIQRYLDAGGI